MFDPSFVAAIDLSFPPEPPRIVEERLWVSEAGRRLEDVARRIADGFEAQTEVWLQKVRRTREDYRSIPPISAEDAAPLIPGLSDFLEDAEAMAVYHATFRSRLAKRASRKTKAAFARDPSVGAVARSFYARLLSTEDRIVEGILEQVLFLKSVRAELEMPQRHAPVFATGAELKTHILSRLHAA